MNTTMRLDEGLSAPAVLLVLRIVRTHRALALASLVGVGLLAARTFCFWSGTYLFLVWNLFLAWVPLLLAHGVAASGRKGVRERAGRWLLAFGWLLFFPNAPYLVTDLVHWAPRPPVPLWLDGLLLIHFAWLGLMLGFASLRLLQAEVARWRGAAMGWVFATAALGLASFGIYLGRFHRWNSWDVVLSPVALAGVVGSRLAQPWAHPRAWGFTLMFAFVLLLAYLMVREVASVAVAPAAFKTTRGDGRCRDLS